MSTAPAAVRAREAVRQAVLVRDKLRRHVEPVDTEPHPLRGPPPPPLSLAEQRRHLDALDAHLADALDALSEALDLPRTGSPDRWRDAAGAAR